MSRWCVRNHHARGSESEAAKKSIQAQGARFPIIYSQAVFASERKIHWNNVDAGPQAVQIRKGVNPWAVACIYGDERRRSEQSGQRETVVSGHLNVRHVFAD